MLLSKAAIINGLLLFLLWYCLAKLGLVPSSVSKAPANKDMSGLVRVVEIQFFFWLLVVLLVMYGLGLYRYLKNGNFELQHLLQVAVTIMLCNIVFQIQLYIKKSQEKDSAAKRILTIENYVSTYSAQYADLFELTENSINKWLTDKVSIFSPEHKSLEWKLDPLIIVNEEKTRFFATLHSISDYDKKRVRAVSRKLVGYKLNNEWTIIPSTRPDSYLMDSKLNRKDAFTIDEFIRIRYLKYFSKQLSYKDLFSFSFFRSDDFNPIHKYDKKTIDEKIELLKTTQAELLDSSTKSILYGLEDTSVKNRRLRKEISQYKSILRRIE